MPRVPVTLNVNGITYHEEIEPDESLLSVLRERLEFTGTKEGCDEGECGACSVLLDGRVVDSCILLALAVQGARIVTIEGLARDGRLHPVQQAFIDNGAVQCGICTPGMIMAAAELLERNPRPTDHEIREAVAGNLCRCTGYSNIVQAIRQAAQVMEVAL